MPNLIFVVFFFDNPISSNAYDWAQFATYFGGILNPIIAIFGTLILGYLAIQVGKQSSDENKLLFILEQRILAYQKLAQNLEKIDNQMSKGVNLLLVIGAFKKKLSTEEQVLKNLTGLEEILLPLAELQSTLNNFPIIYGHLFNYNFDNEEYLTLVNNCKAFITQSTEPLKREINPEIKIEPGKENLQQKFLEDYKTFLLKLKQEII